jgi:large subunit ribosomal protein L29
MNSKEVRALSTEKIQSELENAREELFKLRFQFNSGQLKDSSRLRVIRRKIARFATVLRERTIASQLAAQKEN